jgi:predicted Ser/Thr protein kinase
MYAADAVRSQGTSIDQDSLHLLARRLGSFRIVERIGEGGMGLVFRAVDESLDRPVALKLLRPELVSDEQRRQRMYREARALAQLSHSHIATVYAAGEAEGMVYLAMEYVEGESLRSVLGEKPLPVERAVRFLLAIADALLHAHRVGVIHRDLKPANVMIARGDQVKLVDFGLAKVFRSGGDGTGGSSPDVSTAEGVILGTPAYMSPEQARGTAVDHRSDIFSFGCVGYALLDGHSPFHRDTAIESLMAVCHEIPRPLDEGSDLPGELCRIVHRCLEKAPDDRYQAMEHLLTDLRQFAWRLEHGELTEVPRTAPAAAVTAAVTAGATLTLDTPEEPGPRGRKPIASPTPPGTTAPVSRRRWPLPLLAAGVGAAATLLLLRVGGPPSPAGPDATTRATARPGALPGAPLPAGERPLSTGRGAEPKPDRAPADRAAPAASAPPPVPAAAPLPAAPSPAPAAPDTPASPGALGTASGSRPAPRPHPPRRKQRRDAPTPRQADDTPPGSRPAAPAEPPTELDEPAGDPIWDER